MMIIKDDIRCNGMNYAKGRLGGDVEYIVIHYTATVDASAKNEAIYFKNAKIETSAHYFVDEKEIYQSVDDCNTAWHCGAIATYSPCRNWNSIGIEMCCHKRDTRSLSAEDKDWYFDEETIKNTAELTRYLMKLYGIPVERVLRHYDVTHKICPAPFVHNEGEWKRFKEILVEKEMEDDEVITKGKLNVNGKEYEVNRILKNDENYVKLKDLKDIGFDVGYNAESKVASLGVKVEEVEMNIEGEEEKVHRILKFGENYVRLRDLEGILNIKNDGKKVVICKR